MFYSIYIFTHLTLSDDSGYNCDDIKHSIQKLTIHGDKYIVSLFNILATNTPPPPRKKKSYWLNCHGSRLTSMNNFKN